MMRSCHCDKTEKLNTILRSFILYVKKKPHPNSKLVYLNFIERYFGMRGSSFFPDLLSWLPAFYEATDACLISVQRTVWNQTDIKSCLKMYNTEVNLTATVESGFDVRTGECFGFFWVSMSVCWQPVPVVTCECVCTRLS